MIHKTAEKGNSQALCYIADKHIKDGNIEEGISFLKKATDTGCDTAMYILGKHYMETLPLDSEKATYWFCKAHDNDNEDVVYMLKNMKHTTKTIKILRKYGLEREMGILTDNVFDEHSTVIDI